MLKRKIATNLDDGHPGTKRPRTQAEVADRISRLSDELLLVILSCLSVEELLTCQRLSQRFRILSCDSQLWKAKYYASWVMPRALKIPGLRDASTAHPNNVLYSSKLAKWLEDDHLVKSGRQTNWKWQYKLRHNWSKGTCRLSEVEVAQPPKSIVVAILHRRIALTADSKHGLRAWATQDCRSLIASITLDATPTSIAVNHCSKPSDQIELVLGFEDGSFQLFHMNPATKQILRGFAHPASCNGSLVAIASCAPYLLTMAANRTLSLFAFEDPLDDMFRSRSTCPPRLISSLKSHASCSSPSLSMRILRDEIIGGVTYASPLISGWCVGIQELRIQKKPSVTETAPADCEPLERLATRFQSRIAHSTPIAGTKSFPNTLAYSHPYLLASHSDNTLSMYLVNSTTSKLSIEVSHRLWGHTSAVSGVQVSDRGKAVSVSSRGGEIRLWDLEEFARKRPNAKYSSVAISPGKGTILDTLDSRHAVQGDREFAQALWKKHGTADADELFSNGWVGFDDEQVLVLRERDIGTQLLHCYDFT